MITRVTHIIYAFAKLACAGNLILLATISVAAQNGWMSSGGSAYVRHITAEPKFLQMVQNSRYYIYRDFTLIKGGNYRLSIRSKAVSKDHTFEIQVWGDNVMLTSVPVITNAWTTYTLYFTANHPTIQVRFVRTAPINSTYSSQNIDDVKLDQEIGTITVCEPTWGNPDDEDAADYRYGYNGVERDNEIYGKRNSYSFEYRVHDPRLGRFLSVDPLTSFYPMNSAYTFAANRVIDGIDLEGLEYLSFHHYANGAVAKTEFYKMTDQDTKRLGGTTAGLHNSVPYGPNGKGVVHYFYDKTGNKIDQQTQWEMRQTNGRSNLKFHGLYSGPGSVTYDGKEKSTNFDFDQQPIDWADAIAKRHDVDYAAVASDNYVGFLDDVRTLQADKDMVKRIDDLTFSFLNPFATNVVEGVETPVRTSYSTEMDGTLLGQRIIINSLATYKQWKIDNNLGNENKYKDIREAFKKAHPAVAIILDQTQD